MSQQHPGFSPQDPRAEALMKDPKALKELISSPDAQQLLSLLTRRNGEDLKTAARQAGSGDTAALSSMLAGLYQSPEGKALMDRLQKQLDR